MRGKDALDICKHLPKYLKPLITFTSTWIRTRTEFEERPSVHLLTFGIENLQVKLSN
jgi:hypothetical protein